MLNTAPIAAQTLPTLPAQPPGPSAYPAADADDGASAFARVLDQTATQQRTSTQDGGTRDDAAACADHAGKPGHAPAGARPAAAAARGKPQPQAVTPETLAASRSAAEPDPHTPPPTLDTRPEPGDGAESEATAQALLDLAAWVSGLALPPTARAASSKPSQPHDDASTATGQAAAEPAAVTGPAAQRNWQRGSDADATRASAALQAPGVANAGEASAARAAQRRDPGAVATLSGNAVADASDTRAGAEAALQSLGRTLPPRPQDSLPVDAGSLPALPMATGALASAAASATSSTRHIGIDAPPGSREFAPVLGAQLAVLVRDGIEHAQLRLNPAELGPIDVRITLDGAQAQVDFAAAHASTRQALQEAVPVLAGALRESGLTLSGGGVFEQPREPRGEARPASPDAAMAADAGARDSALTGSVSARLPRARGVLDLYA